MNNKKSRLSLIFLCSLLIALFSFACGNSNGPGPIPQSETVATPEAIPGEGIYPEAQNVILSCATDGASIYYTTDRSTPTTSSTPYTGPIAIDQTSTIKAIAVKGGMNNSSILTAEYVINIYNPEWETVATPTANPAGGTIHTGSVTVTLSCDTDGASIRYTTDGNTPTANSAEYATPIAITQTSTLKAIAVKEGMNNSSQMSETYTILTGDEPVNKTVTLGTSVTGQLVISLTGTATLFIANYTDPATIAAFTMGGLTAQEQGYLSGRSIQVSIDATSALPRDISLAYVHYLREALKTTGANASGISVNAPEAKFTPVFSGEQWWAEQYYWPSGAQSGNLLATNLYSKYSQDTEIMNGIVILKDANDKYVIEYNRAIKVSDLVWQNNDKSIQTPILGIGLKKKNGGNGSISAVTNWGNVRIHGGIYEYESFNNVASVSNWANYETTLKDAGLHPSQKDAFNNSILLDHSVVDIRLPNTTAATEKNIPQNGMYDFILAYYNPAATGATSAQERSKGLLPGWPSDLTFDGRYWPGNEDGTNPNNGFSRNIGGTVSANPLRKGTDGVSGAPNGNFVGSMTVAMAVYLNSLHYLLRNYEFKNTNIIGDGVQWNGTTDLNLSGLTNVALMGSYSGMYVLVSQDYPKIHGVVDITGTAPSTISNALGTPDGYLVLWSVPDSDIGVNRFNVISIKDSDRINRVNATNPWGTSAVPANVIIYPQKYAVGTLSGESPDLIPDYRAFYDNGVAKIVPFGTTPAINAAYLGSVTSNATLQPAAYIDEAKWISLTNAGILSAATVAYSDTGDFRWDATAFNALPVE